MVSLSAFETRGPGSIPRMDTYFQSVFFSSSLFSILMLNYFIEKGHHQNDQNGCIGIQAHGHQVTLFSQNVIIMWYCISAYSGYSGCLFKKKSMVSKKKNPLFEWGWDRKICFSASHFVISRQASWCQTEILVIDFSTPPSHSWWNLILCYMMGIRFTTYPGNVCMLEFQQAGVWK